MAVKDKLTGDHQFLQENRTLVTDKEGAELAAELFSMFMAALIGQVTAEPVIRTRTGKNTPRPAGKRAGMCDW